MSDVHPAGARRERSETASHLARWLGLAATPTFAVMALLTAAFSGGPMEMLCSGGHGLSLGGMVPMYVLMSAFHSAAWLRLFSGRRPWRA